MIVKSLRIHNENISYDDLHFDFSSKGIYLIRGENGTGKSTILKELVYGRNDIRFPTDSQNEAYKNNRGSLFSYLPQDLDKCAFNIEEYLFRGNKHVDKARLQELLLDFDLKGMDLKKKYNKLSGGEKVKIAVISVLLKNTPYIFMDEPTNNMDDATVEMLCGILTKVARDKTIIIVTHDDRVSLCYNSVYTLNSTRCDIKDGGLAKVINGEQLGKIQGNSFSIVSLVGKSRMNFLIIAYLVVVTIFIVIFSNFELKLGFSKENFGDTNVICSYEVDYEYGLLNQEYCKSQGLVVDNERMDTLITYADIPNIALNENVEKIILFDEVYFHKLSNSIYNHALLDNIHIISLPESVVEFYYDQYPWEFDISFLKSGNYPKDNMNQVVVSDSLLVEFFDYEAEATESAIGDKIEIDNHTYEIVGISYTDICIVSYSDDDINYGFYRYDTLTYDSFMDETINYKLNVIDTFAYNYVNTCLFYCTDNSLLKVQNELITNYPATNYISKPFSQEWSAQHNMKVRLKLAMWILGVSLLFGLLLLGVTSFVIPEYKKQYILLLNYYLEFRRIQVLNRIAMIVIYIVPIVISFFLSLFSTEYSEVISWYFIPMAIVILSPTMLYAMLRKNRVVI